jgi:hypothetical protein
MTPIEIFDARKADVLQTMLDLAKLANPPFDAEPRRHSPRDWNANGAHMMPRWRRYAI